MLLVLDPDTEFHDRVTSLADEAGLRSLPVLTTTRGELEEVVTRGTVPGAVVIGPGVDLPVATAVSSWLQGVAPDVVTVLVALPTTTTLRAALRAGFRDVLSPSCTADEFAETLRAAGYDERRSDHGRPGLTIAVFSAKGGVGTSVLASNLAVRLASTTEVDCILADLDLPSADQAVLHGVRPSWTVQEIADGVVGADVDAVSQVLLPIAGTGVQLLAGPSDPAAAETIGDDVVVDVLHRLRELAPLVVIDTSSAFSDATLAILEQADVIVLVVSLDVLSLRSLTVTMQTFERLGIPRDRLRVAVMRAGAKVGLSTDDVVRATGASVDVAIPSSRQVATSVNTGVPLAVDSPRSTVVRAVDELVELVLRGATIDGFDGEVEGGRGGLLGRLRPSGARSAGAASDEATPPAPLGSEVRDDGGEEADEVRAPRRVVRVVQTSDERPEPPAAARLEPVPAPVAEIVTTPAVTEPDEVAADGVHVDEVAEPGGPGDEAVADTDDESAETDDDLASLPPPRFDTRPANANGTTKRSRRRAARS